MKTHPKLVLSIGSWKELELFWLEEILEILLVMSSMILKSIKTLSIMLINRFFKKC